jgi:hypothetical protein
MHIQTSILYCIQVLRKTDYQGCSQAHRYNKHNSYFKHSWRENPFDMIYKSHHMDDNENLQK